MRIADLGSLHEKCDFLTAEGFLGVIMERQPGLREQHGKTTEIWHREEIWERRWLLWQNHKCV